MSEVARHEPSSEIVPGATDPTGGRLVAWADGLSAAHRIGTALCQTAFVPKHFANKPEEAAAAILFGDEIGFTPTQALRSIYVINGAPALYARSMVALVLSAGHRIWTDEDTPTKVTVSGQRRGTNAVETVTWTNDRAKKAGYTTNKKYDTDPQAMLYARASGDIARRIAPDVLAGLAYTVEEMELSEQPATVTRTRTTAKKTAKREQLDPPTPDEPDLDEPAKSAADINPHGDTPEPITEQQMKKLQASYGDAGITERQDKLDYAVTIIDRPLDSARDLSKDEASKVIDALAQYGSVDPSATDEQTELDPAEGDGWGT